MWHLKNEYENIILIILSLYTHPNDSKSNILKNNFQFQNFTKNKIFQKTVWPMSIL